MRRVLILTVAGALIAAAGFVAGVRSHHPWRPAGAVQAVYDAQGRLIPPAGAVIDTVGGEIVSRPVDQPEGR